jgi:putative MFS transporter
MVATPRLGTSAIPASHVLGSKLDSIPFSPYHLLVILVLGLVGLVDGYDLAMTGSLLVLAKEPLHITPGEIRMLAGASNLMICVGGFTASAISDHWSRRTIMLIGVATTNVFTLLIPLVPSGEQLIIIRMLTGLAGGFAVSAPFPIAAELMPAQHRRTYGAIYEIMLASSITLLPLVAFMVADNPNGFRLIALPATLGLFVVPVLVYLLIPESPRWYLRKGNSQAAIEVVNRIISRCGDRVAPLAALPPGEKAALAREELPSFTALFRRGQLRWTVIGILSLICAQAS